MMKEVQRVIKPTGIYFAISFGAPAEREMHLKREHLSFEI
jgi:ubiquinone/menaquinone biosynthesis C-methylase UbiE